MDQQAATEHVPSVSYQLQFRKCGNKNCQCRRKNIEHGPYWYAFWREGDKNKSQYIGKDMSKLGDNIFTNKKEKAVE